MTGSMKEQLSSRKKAKQLYSHGDTQGDCKMCAQEEENCEACDCR